MIFFKRLFNKTELINYTWNIEEIFSLFLWRINMEHKFNIDIATHLGLNEAIVINGITDLIKKNMNNKDCFREGRLWTKGTADTLLSHFPYLTKSKLRSTLKTLEDSGVLIISNLNANKFDRTKWYALGDI